MAKVKMYCFHFWGPGVAVFSISWPKLGQSTSKYVVKVYKTVYVYMYKTHTKQRSRSRSGHTKVTIEYVVTVTVSKGYI